MEINEIEILENYIKRNFKSKEEFAASIGMTRQNLNHHFRLAKANKNLFTYQFRLKLWSHNVNVFAIEKAKAEFHIPTKTLRESDAPYGNDIYALNKIIEMQDDKIKRLEDEIMRLKNIKANTSQKAS
jgi:hypothetical protein